MPTLEEAFAIAVAHHQCGRLAQAEQVYRQILGVEPNYVDALHLLGVLASQVGQHDFAIQCMGRALQLRPDFADAHNNLGNVFVNQGMLDEAVAAFVRALELKPNYSEAHYNLGNALLQQGKADEAIGAFRRAVELKPDLTDAHSNLGSALRNQGKLEEASACFRQVLKLKPDAADAHSNLGNVLLDQGKPVEAIACFRKALELKSDFADAYNNLGNAFMSLGRLDEAVGAFRRALDLKPNYPEGQYNLANALADQGALDEAVGAFRRALELKPDFADAHNNLGNVFRTQGKLDEAKACFDRALNLKPDLAEARVNRSFLLLLQGDFEHGWLDYQWRLRTRSHSPRALSDFDQPLWDGRPLQGQTILLHAEQGLGDVLQFIRYVPWVQQCGGTVVVECPSSLVSLLENCPSVSSVLAEGEPRPQFDVQAPLLSLPGIFRTTLHDLPASVPYLFVRDEVLARWQAELMNQREIKIGIVWQGNPQNPADRSRSIPWREFAPLMELPNLKFYSLQKDAGQEQLLKFAARQPITDLSQQLTDFQETAAAVKNLDLVISCDTAVAHLTGALGVPIWMAIPLMPDWRWLLGRQDSPWYPTMRLFRQTEPGDWPGVFERMAKALRKLVEARSLAD